MKNFAGKTAFITGGASGAGLGQAQVFGRAGMKVCIADIRQDHLDSALAVLRGEGIECHGVLLNVTDREAFAAAADEVERVYGVPELLVLTAGVNTFGPAECSTYGDFDWVMGVNLGGVVNGLVTFVPRMIQAGIHDGHIAMTASWGGFEGGAITAPYAAAKAAVINLADSYYQALRPYGIGVTALCPENIRSNIFESEKTRPETMAATGYNIDDKTIGFLRDFHSRGMDPIVLAGWLKDGIEAGQVIVVPYDDAEQKMRDVYEKFICYASPAGMQRLAEREKKMAEEAADANRTVVMDEAFVTSGWGKANTNISWVDDSKKKQ